MCGTYYFFSIVCVTVNNLSLISLRPHLTTNVGAAHAMLLMLVPCLPVILFSGFLALVREGKGEIPDRHLTKLSLFLIVS